MAKVQMLLDYLENRSKFQIWGGDEHPSDGVVCYRGRKNDAFGRNFILNCL